MTRDLYDEDEDDYWEDEEGDEDEEDEPDYREDSEAEPDHWQDEEDEPDHWQDEPDYWPEPDEDPLEEVEELHAAAIAGDQAAAEQLLQLIPVLAAELQAAREWAAALYALPRTFDYAVTGGEPPTEGTPLVTRAEAKAADQPAWIQARVIMPWERL
ncbi:hypothetical protein [Streptosporangium saharense]|uniref:hypothetical protein n=1 Tax=Streptosporangium saharense TaxID=1706840 RepID=UPI003413A910